MVFVARTRARKLSPQALNPKLDRITQHTLEAEKMKKVSMFALVLLAVLLVEVNVQLLKPCSAVARLPGVAPAQFLHYSINMTVTGNDTELMTNAPQSQFAWGNATVLSVQNVSVTFQLVFYNETTNQPATIMQDIETGQANFSMVEFYFAFYAANLSAGDPITAGYGNPPSINETVIAEYLGQQLETNQLVISYGQTQGSVYGYLVNYTSTVQSYWERKTGIILDYHVDQDCSRSDGAGGFLITQFEKRVLLLFAVPSPPVIPEFPPSVVLTLFVAMTLLAIAVYARRLRRERALAHETLGAR